MEQPASVPAPPSQLRVVLGARNGRSADHLRRGERPPARFWIDEEAEPPRQAPAPVTAAPAPGPSTAQPEVLALLASQARSIELLLAGQQRLLDRIAALERSQPDG